MKKIVLRQHSIFPVSCERGICKKAQKDIGLSVSCLLKFTLEEHSKRCAFIYMEKSNNDKINKAWAAFNMSGKVEDYLNFTALQNPLGFTEVNPDADCNRRSHNQSEGYR